MGQNEFFANGVTVRVRREMVDPKSVKLYSGVEGPDSLNSTSIKNLANIMNLAKHAGEVFHRTATRQAVVALSDQAFASLNNFLTGIIIGRFCAKEQFGLYTLCFTIVLFVSNLQTALISSPYMVYSTRLKGSDLSSYSGSTLIHELALSLLTIVFLSLFGFVLSLGVGPAGLAMVVWALVPTITFILLKEYVRQIFFARQFLTRALLLDASVLILQIGCLLVLSSLQTLSARSAYWVVGSACGSATAFWLILLHKNFVIRRERLVVDFIRNWSFSRWVVAGSLVLLGSTELYPWFLASTHGAGATGILAACMGAIYLANPFLMGMMNFLGPKTAQSFANGGIRELRVVVARGTFVFVLAMVPFCMIMLLFGGTIVVVLYGHQYAGNGTIVGLLALSQLVSALTFPLNYGLLVMERPDEGFRSYLLALTITVSLGWWLVKSFGPMGVACGLLAGNLAASGFRWRAFRAHIRSLSKARD